VLLELFFLPTVYFLKENTCWNIYIFLLIAHSGPLSLKQEYTST
jgi:hypothetical protein